MTDEAAAMVEFLRSRHADKVRNARDIARVLEVQGADGALGLTPETAAAEARSTIHAAEARARFFEETVVPFLGTAGPVGRIAEQQLRLLAWEHEGHRDYQPGWAP